MESEKDRVRRHTARSVLCRIDTAARLLECAEGGDFDLVPKPGNANPGRRVRAALSAVDA